MKSDLDEPPSPHPILCQKWTASKQCSLRRKSRGNSFKDARAHDRYILPPYSSWSPSIQTGLSSMNKSILMFYGQVPLFGISIHWGHYLCWFFLFSWTARWSRWIKLQSFIRVGIPFFRDLASFPWTLLLLIPSRWCWERKGRGKPELNVEKTSSKRKLLTLGQ